MAVCEVANPPMEIPGNGTSVIYIQGDIHRGLGQRYIHADTGRRRLNDNMQRMVSRAPRR